MNIQRFTAATSREALSKARMAFGDSTLILSNRTTENGVEVVATAEETLAALDQNSRGAQQLKPQAKPQTQQQAPNPSYQEAAAQVEDDANQLAMSTLSFQDYVRERMLRRRHEADAALNAASASSSQSSSPAAKTVTSPNSINGSPASQSNTNAARQSVPLRGQTGMAPIKTKPAAGSSPKLASVQLHQPSETMPQGIANELHAMKEMMEERFNTLAWLGQARQNPIQSNLMLRMLRAGYSPTLSRAILEKMPTDLDATQSMRWMMDVLERNLRTDRQKDSIAQEGGVYALVGATGVGKTTTAAKLAGQCAAEYGAASVGLITLDTYRVGAHEQLRAYGKLLGVVAHLAHDRSALQDLLGLLSNKKMVLIDTTGLAPRDPRKNELLELIDLPKVRRVLVLNAGAHGETLDESTAAFKTPGVQQAIFSKIDEAVKLGPAIDVAIRHQLLVRGVTNGQRVPQDWEAANAANLVRMSMRATGSNAYDTKASDLSFYFNEPLSHGEPRSQLHA